MHFKFNKYLNQIIFFYLVTNSNSIDFWKFNLKPKRGIKNYYGILRLSIFNCNHVWIKKITFCFYFKQKNKKLILN